MDGSLMSPWIAWALCEARRVQLIDLRARDELPRIGGARAIPPEELSHELATLDRERPAVFCRAAGAKPLTRWRCSGRPARRPMRLPAAYTPGERPGCRCSTA